MGYKKIGENLSFADVAVLKSLEHNRSLKMMEKINEVCKNEVLAQCSFFTRKDGF